MSQVFKLYQKLSGFPYGEKIFTRLFTFKVPYFTTIRPEIKKLEVGICEVEMKDRRSIRNHLGTVHAIAMCNLCELAMGLVTESSIPEDLRWIPKGMQVSYLKKAKGTLLGKSRIESSAFKPGEVIVPISIVDSVGDEVARADITLHITRHS